MTNIINMSPDFQDRSKKTFIKVGASYIDIKRAVGVSFYRDFNYVGVQFIFENGKALTQPFKNRNELSLFLLEFEKFIDDNMALPNINDIINEIEAMPPIDINKFLKNNNENNLENDKQNQ